jgi:outer membrane protein assembly factor BamB
MLVAAGASAILFVLVLATMLQGRGRAAPSLVAGGPGLTASEALSGGPGETGSAVAPGSFVPASVLPAGGGPLQVTASAGDIGTDIHLAAGPDDGVYVTIPNRDHVVLALLASDGLPGPGWPVRLPASWCPTLLAAPDGSVRVICEGPVGDGIQAPTSLIYGFDRTGGSLPNWPVQIESASAAGMVGSDLTVAVVPYQGDALEPGSTEHARIAVIAANGQVRAGSEVPLFSCCQNMLAIAPDGTGYISGTRDWDTAVKTDVLAFDLGGVRDGWPLVIEGNASPLVFDAQSRLHAFVAGADGGRRTLVLDGDGQIVSGSSDGLPDSTNPWTGAGAENPGSPVVAADGTSFVVGSADGTTIAALDPGSRPLGGWPFHSDRSLELRGFCSADETGCGQFRSTPVVGTGNTLYVSLASPGNKAGGRIVALGPDGKVMDGWPLTLRRAGSMFWTMEPGRDGVWALAVEPEARGYSATILAVSADSTVRWKATIVEP